MESCPDEGERELIFLVCLFIFFNGIEENSKSEPLNLCLLGGLFATLHYAEFLLAIFNCFRVTFLSPVSEATDKNAECN